MFSPTEMTANVRTIKHGQSEQEIVKLTFEMHPYILQNIQADKGSVCLKYVL